jgi:hypothetical protein
VNYLHGKVVSPIGLTVITETREKPWVCCGYCSAHMACWTAKEGVSKDMFQEAHDIREAAGRPHPAGSKASELKAGAKAAVGVTLETVSKLNIPTRLREGYTVVVSLQYAQLPGYLRNQTNDFGHSAVLHGWREGNVVGFYDPLWAQGAQGAWAPWEDIDQALWDSGHLTTVVVRESGDTELAINTSGAGGVTTGKHARILRDTGLYEEATGDGRLATGKTGYKYDYVGVPLGASRYAVIVNTAIPYNDGVVRPTILYINKVDAVIESKPDAPEDCADDVLAARKAEYTRVKAGTTYVTTLKFPPAPS